MDARFEILSHLSDTPDVVAGWTPVVRQWWTGKFSGLTAPQALALRAIQNGLHVLITAPTGSGKTLCAFTTIISDLLAQQQNGTLRDGIQAVYISPLRALGADIARNLQTPLDQISALMGDEQSTVRVGVRSGDTTSHQRRKMAQTPPHILVTTPESLALCLAQEKMRGHLRGVRTIIIDELHALAGNKRGVDLAVSIERLARLAFISGGKDPQRIGLSATIAPLETMAGFLVGSAHAARSCAIADATFNRPMDLDIAAPFGKTPFCTTATINKRVYDELENIIRNNRTTIIFTNLRSATERVTFALRQRFAAGYAGPLSAGELDPQVGPEQIEAHHSSVDPDKRREIEERLKAGALRCVVCSTSLELGIDIGTVDRVVLLNSPKGVARGLQRVGRAGHWHGGTARGTFMPTVPADLIESIVTADAMRRRHLDAIETPRGCLDVLAQQLIGMTIEAGANGLNADEALALLRQTWPYENLDRHEFEDVVAFVARTSHAQRTDEESDAQAIRPPGRKGPVLALREGKLFCASLATAALYAQNVGTITSEGHIKVMLREGGCIGSVEEAFAALLKIGDRFVLGGQCVEFISARHMAIEVAPAKGRTPTVPRWFSGSMAMGQGLCESMRHFRARVKAIAPAGAGAIRNMLLRQWRVSEDVAHVSAEYLCAQHQYAEIPTDDMLLVERVPDEDSVALIFHTMLGRAANEAIARAVAFRFSRNFGGNAAVVIDDYAFGIWVPPSAAVRRADRALLRTLLSPRNFEPDVARAIDCSELFRTQFRYTAVRSHALVKNRFGKQQFIGVIQAYATRLHDALIRQSPDHLLLRETRRTVLRDILCTPIAAEYLMRAQNLPLRIVDLPSPSPFAFGLFATGRRDTMQLADTSDFLLAMYKQVQKRLAASAKEEPQEAMLF